MRFTVTYRIFADSQAEAQARAQEIALEQTVEIPRDLVPAGYVTEEILGRVEEIGPEAEGRFRASISYSPDSAGAELAQFLNVVFGNSSIQRGLRVIGIDPGEEMIRRHPGPRFGIEGIRALCGRPRGGLIAPVLKPQGLDADALAELGYLCARAGADVIKEDHGIMDQPMAPFRERVEKTAMAIARANAETGGKALYFASLAGAPDEAEANIRFAKQAGVDGLLVMPGLVGFGLVARIARDPWLNLPVMTHPAFLGPHVLSPDTGFDHGVMFGTLQRVAGADISVFPNVGGRFGFSAGECGQIAAACRDPRGPGLTMLPSPGGGMSVARAADMAAMYGADTVYLLGGALLRLGTRIGEGIAAMRAELDRADQARS
ncbi:ribulose-bisphosphate carboxylase [Defluviimonas sp. 20V17]|uniref:Ribulose 1,5-bisphosphate carboxylase large subunit n=1 Tax=Allgaiera indica TaxID=765699 RepID=A0AAN4UQC3_9RHOB|nr:RuBisCO large subunit C-terminal-like domain-containing protein [Allgaiera indica]KDB03681.1 ribulose-bisphosphate carboxylase [Defluviimonas sp. 20V17]GHD99876.1 ribulose-bisphosphate carboxylase [Allgaiera indica]SDW41510.1 ribulose-1,5-bisphosphate carboxylase/oxygenase large subunit [Allgaiera indica]